MPETHCVSGNLLYSHMHQAVQKPGNPVLIVAFRDLIRGFQDVSEGVPDSHAAAAPPDRLDIIVVIAEEHRMGRIDPESIEHVPDAVPFGGGTAHDLEQFPLGNGIIGIIRKVYRQMFDRELRVAGEDLVVCFRPGKIQETIRDFGDHGGISILA